MHQIGVHIRLSTSLQESICIRISHMHLKIRRRTTSAYTSSCQPPFTRETWSGPVKGIRRRHARLMSSASSDAESTWPKMCIRLHRVESYMIWSCHFLWQNEKKFPLRRIPKKSCRKQAKKLLQGTDQETVTEMNYCKHGRGEYWLRSNFDTVIKTDLWVKPI